MKIDTTETERTCLNLQFFATLLFLCTIIVSAFLVYNQIYYLNNKKYLVSEEETALILKINRTIALILIIVFLYLNYKNE